MSRAYMYRRAKAFGRGLRLARALRHQEVQHMLRRRQYHASEGRRQESSDKGLWKTVFHHPEHECCDLYFLNTICVTRALVQKSGRWYKMCCVWMNVEYLCSFFIIKRSAWHINMSDLVFNPTSSLLACEIDVPSLTYVPFAFTPSRSPQRLQLLQIGKLSSRMQFSPIVCTPTSVTENPFLQIGRDFSSNPIAGPHNNL